MSKRNSSVMNESINNEAESFEVLRKRVKSEHDFIISKSKQINKNIDLTEHEVYKFLIILHTLIESADFTDEITEETDGVVTDIIIKIVLKKAELIKQNIDTLPLPNILKQALKTIKEIFNGKKQTEESGRGSVEEELKEPSGSSSSSGGSSSGETTSSNSSSPASTTAASTTGSN